MKKAPQNPTKFSKEQAPSFPNHTLKKSPRIEVTHRRMTAEEARAFERAADLLLADIVRWVMEQR